MRIGRIVVPDGDGPLDDSWWMPLIIFLGRLKDEGQSDLFLLDLDWRDFMVMHGVDRAPRPFVIAYKHVDSRGYLHIDRDGWAYRWRAVKGSDEGRLTSHRTLRDALTGVDVFTIVEANRARGRWHHRPPSWTDDDGWEDDPPDVEPATADAPIGADRPPLRLIR